MYMHMCRGMSFKLGRATIYLYTDRFRNFFGCFKNKKLWQIYKITQDEVIK